MSVSKKIKAVSVVERVMLVVASLLIAMGVFAISAHASERQSPAAPSIAPVPSPAPGVSPAPTSMGPVVPEVEKVSNVVEVPTEMVGVADCFNIYRNNVLIGDCVKPKIDEVTGHYYFDDSSPEVVPASRWTYEISAVNATGESPRVNQGGPYPDNGIREKK